MLITDKLWIEKWSKEIYSPISKTYLSEDRERLKNEEWGYGTDDEPLLSKNIWNNEL